MDTNVGAARDSGQAGVKAITPAVIFNAFSADVLKCLDAQSCTDIVLSYLHPNGPACPSCGQPVTEHSQRCRFWGLKRIACKSCNTFFTAKSGTILQNSQFDTAEIFVLAVLLEFAKILKEGNSDKLIAEILKIDPETVRLWRKKFEIIPETQIEPYTDSKII